MRLSTRVAGYVGLLVFATSLLVHEGANSDNLLKPTRPTATAEQKEQEANKRLASLLSRGPGDVVEDNKATGHKFLGPAAAADEKMLKPQHSIYHMDLDMQSMPKEDWPYLFYLSAFNFPKEDRRAVWETLCFVTNSLSCERTIKKPVIVANTDDSLFRVDLRWYGWKRQALENFVAKGSGQKPLPEPYFYLTVVDQDYTTPKQETYQYTDPKTGQVKTGTRNVQNNQPTANKTKQTLAPWLPPLEAKNVSENIGTQYPIARADWFIAYSLLAPAYYDLLNLGNKEEDFQAFVLFDKANAEKVELRGTSRTRVVALNNRILIRYATIASYEGGYYWESNDFETSVDENDVLNNLFAKARAKELIASGLNGLQYYFLSDANGLRTDVAPVVFAQDSETPHQDKQVWCARNCITCHQIGIREFRNQVKALAQGKIAALVPDPHDAKKVEDRYFAYDIEALIQKDQAKYAAAVVACNGLTPAGNASQYQAIEFNYLEKEIDLELMAREVGVHKDELQDILKRSVNIDHSLTALLQNPPINAQREQFERRGYGQLGLLLLQTGDWEIGEDLAPKEEPKENKE